MWWIVNLEESNDDLVKSKTGFYSRQFKCWGALHFLCIVTMLQGFDDVLYYMSFVEVQNKREKIIPHFYKNSVIRQIWFFNVKSSLLIVEGS